ncbi:prolyl oligopeptidase family serine peptidase [Poriferisphaera sp. WC338]|uniref:carboxylesterase family protein n=1 Tax=Poriferisphaera sp. WC338 TaxID=3425129 RepID=UPI003D81A5B3
MARNDGWRGVIKYGFMIVLLAVAGCANGQREGMPDSMDNAKSHGEWPQISKSELGLDYLLYLPRGYTLQPKKSFPLLLYLHGFEQRGELLSKVREVGVPKQLEDGRDFGMIVVAPQVKARKAWNKRELGSLLDEIEATYRVDIGRIYVTGEGIGGYGTYVLAGDRPERYAAIAPISSAAYVEQSVKLRTVPVWVFHGKLDGIVPVESAVDMVYALDALGGLSRLTIYEQGDHNIAEKVYAKDELYAWLLKHKRILETGKIVVSGE